MSIATFCYLLKQHDERIEFTDFRFYAMRSEQTSFLWVTGGAVPFGLLPSKMLVF